MAPHSQALAVLGNYNTDIAELAVRPPLRHQVPSQRDGDPDYCAHSGAYVSCTPTPGRSILHCL